VAYVPYHDLDIHVLGAAETHIRRNTDTLDSLHCTYTISQPNLGGVVMAVATVVLVPAQTQETVNIVLCSWPGLRPLTKVECRIRPHDGLIVRSLRTE